MNNWKWFLPGYLLALPHTLAGLIICLLYYRAKDWEIKDGTLMCTSSRFLIGGEWVGGQSWGNIIIFKDERNRDRESLVIHERVHVVQGMLLGPLYLLSYGLHFLVNLVWYRDWKKAYRLIWAERMAYRIQAEFLTKLAQG